MLDSTLADLHGIETRALVQAVARNIERFPGDFCFRLDTNEVEDLRSQVVMSSSGWGGRRNAPYAFTEQGIAMLSSVLRSPAAIAVNIEITALAAGTLSSRMPVKKLHVAPNEFLHAASVVALADTSCGYATIAHLPEGAASFTTIELKSNFLGTVREGAVACTATAQHLGRNTQVWDAIVTNEATGRKIALFRCTQMVLWPK